MKPVISFTSHLHFSDSCLWEIWAAFSAWPLPSENMNVCFLLNTKNLQYKSQTQADQYSKTESCELHSFECSVYTDVATFKGCRYIPP